MHAKQRPKVNKYFVAAQLAVSFPMYIIHTQTSFSPWFVNDSIGGKLSQNFFKIKHIKKRK